MKIPITKPFFDEDDLSGIQQPLKSGWVVQGPRVEEFERGFARFSGAQHAVASSSCTTALHLSLAGLGIGKDDEVIVPAFTWVATANAVVYQGATPVFCDIDLRTFNLDPAKLEDRISQKTKAVLPVHLFGLSAEMNSIQEICEKHQLKIVEDAACGFGAYYNDQHVGNFGDTGCFSFHPRKAITTGEGGMIITQDGNLAERCRSLRNHGATISDHARHEDKQGFLLAEYNDLGFNYRMTDIQAALGLSQLTKADWILQKRKEKALRYNELLSKLNWLTTPLVPDNCDHAYQSYVCIFEPENLDLDTVSKLHILRSRLMANLQEKGVATRQGTHSVPGLKYYQARFGCRPDEFPNAFLADRVSIALPLFAQMTDGEQDYVVEMLDTEFNDLYSG